MWTVSNALSMARIPLAGLFVVLPDPAARFYLVLLAMTSDALDGYLARRWGEVSHVGTMLDPFADKVFVLFALGAYVYDGTLTFGELAVLMSRDFSVFFFTLYILLTKRAATYPVRAIWCGKITTALQFVVLLLLTVGWPLPVNFLPIFLLLGVSALIELSLPLYTLA